MPQGVSSNTGTCTGTKQDNLKFIDNILYIEFQELLNAGVSENTLKWAKRNESRSWEFIEDPSDRRKVLIKYDALKEIYKGLIIDKLCGGVTSYEYLSVEILNSHLISKNEDIVFFDTFMYNSKVLENKIKAQAVEACKYLYMLERYRLATAKKTAFPMWDVHSFWTNLSFHIRSNKVFERKSLIKIPTAPAKINSLAKLYITNGPSVVVSGKIANKNSSKLGKLVVAGPVNGKKHSDFSNKTYAMQLAFLIELSAHFNNLDFEQIAFQYNLAAKHSSWPNLSGRQVENILKDASNDRISYAGRKGTSAYYNEKAMQVKRRRPSKPLQYVTVDGWTVELVYQGNVGDKMFYTLRHVMVVVLDAYNNYPLGYAIGDRETAELIKGAFRDAINHARELTGEIVIPYQVQSDRYALKQMTYFYSAAAHLFTPARVGNAKSKVVEPYFKYINRKYCQLLPNWSGFNLTARKENQPNREWKDKIKQSFPDKTGNIRQIDEIIARERAIKGDKYKQALITADKFLLKRENYLKLFGVAALRTIKLTGKGICPEIAGVRYSYDTFDVKFREHAHRDWRLTHDPENMDNVLVEADGYQFLLEKKYEQPMGIFEQTDEDRLQLAAIREFNKKDVKEIIAKRFETTALVQQFLADNPALAETNLKLMFTHNGQQKEGLQDAKMLGAARKQIEKARKEEDKINEMEWASDRDSYIESKNIDFDKYK